ncbi:hypothetical protein [Hymenobacter crusticola]|uniref:Uncharacterized protein n=1 Tax=Hymenobacter crusticola TaxID=1770526 RepID=A0A243W4Y2_9BACT|nr:hypothetical protein [Hymenobacter crusticola]OUJ67752.1 hypothetical protein BXP70_28625 [Hymenobacter crusticola]
MLAGVVIALGIFVGPVFIGYWILKYSGLIKSALLLHGIKWFCYGWMMCVVVVLTGTFQKMNGYYALSGMALFCLIVGVFAVLIVERH